MYGVCEAWMGVLPSPAPAAYCGQVNRRHQLGPNTAIHTQAFTVTPVKSNPYEDEPTISLPTVLGSGGGCVLALGPQGAVPSPLLSFLFLLPTVLLCLPLFAFSENLP